MQSFISAVGLGGHGTSSWTSVQSSKAQPKDDSDKQSLPIDDLRPDLARIAAATEPGILALEQEARGLATAPLQTALACLQQWSQGLRRRPRPEEPLASFKAQFLRSNALERALEGLRKNGAVRAAIFEQELLTLPPAVPPASPPFGPVANPSGGYGTNSEQTSRAQRTTSVSPPELVLASELRSILQLCLQRAAAPAAVPVLRAALAIGDGGQASERTALLALRALKEDWIEVVFGQALRGLERRLDSLSYELQKSAIARKEHLKGEGDAAGLRRASRDRVTVLALLCSALAETRSRVEARAVEAVEALGCAGLLSEDSGGREDGSVRAIMDGDSNDDSRSSQHDAAHSECTASMLNKAKKVLVDGTGESSLPSVSDCETAVSSMLLKTLPGMREGLSMLGLPNEPVSFTPGEELRLQNIDVRDAVIAMIGHWVQDERTEFFESLKNLRSIFAPLEVCDDPNLSGTSTTAVSLRNGELLAKRDRLLDERRELFERLAEIDKEIKDVSLQLAESVSDGSAEVGAANAAVKTVGGPIQLIKDVSVAMDPSCAPEVSLPSGRASAAADAASDAEEAAPSTQSGVGNGRSPRLLPSFPTSIASSRTTTLPKHTRFFVPPASSSHPKPFPTDDASGETIGNDLASVVGSVAKAVAGESQRAVERLATQLQERRGQLVESLAQHLESERERLFAKALADDVKGISGTDMGAAVAQERLTKCLLAARELCDHAELAVGGRSDSKAADTFPVGMRCRARWIDGKFYDAAVQSVTGDGSVVLNWLRPCADAATRSSIGSKLVTVSEVGGDDTLHRIVPREDVRPLQDAKNGVRSKSDDAEAAKRLFESRTEEDLLCASCAILSGGASAENVAVDAGASAAKWALVSFGLYLCESCAHEHEALGARVCLVRELGDGWGWKHIEIEHMRHGGNAAFCKAMERYPALRGLSTKELFTSRFAEFYRRHIDAICTSAQLPQVPSQEAAAQPGTAEFVGGVEAIAAVKEVAERFELAAGVAALPTAWRGCGGPSPLVPRSSQQL
eukprot:TRINITY_DN44878_c0_g1_i1.p1 TRINITY_DN44878_c0_g1~~TRINITY_DN44878_c0_g1_i1.p1  ORF type:complete len:1030 (+),score=194.91 TRINITY_DN44878_c0_g1_i1:183-3272(+)